MRDVSEWMGKRPTRKCVRAEPLMDDRKRRCDSRIRQVGEVNLDLFRRKHSFVDDRAGGQTVEVEFGCEFFNSLLNEVKLSFEFVVAVVIRISVNYNLIEYELNVLLCIAE